MTLDGIRWREQNTQAQDDDYRTYGELASADAEAREDADADVDLRHLPLPVPRMKVDAHLLDLFADKPWDEAA